MTTFDRACIYNPRSKAKWDIASTSFFPGYNENRRGMMLKYYIKVAYGGKLFGLVRQEGRNVERYDGKGIWNDNWSGSGQAYMDICGMGDGWGVFREIPESAVEEIKHQLDERFEQLGLFSYKKGIKQPGL
jgi:hypothetical protein